MFLFYYFCFIGAENPAESLYRNLLENYDKRIPAMVDGNWTKIYHAFDLIWLSNVNTANSELWELNNFR